MSRDATPKPKSDEYHRLLAIPRREPRPPNYFALLGVSVDEDDEDVILGSADRNMRHLHAVRGDELPAAQRLLSDIAKARHGLADEQYREAYRACLKAGLNHAEIMERFSSEDLRSGTAIRSLTAPPPPPVPAGATAAKVPPRRETKQISAPPQSTPDLPNRDSRPPARLDVWIENEELRSDCPECGSMMLVDLESQQGTCAACHLQLAIAEESLKQARDILGSRPNVRADSSIDGSQQPSFAPPVVVKSLPASRRSSSFGSRIEQRGQALASKFRQRPVEQRVALIVIPLALMLFTVVAWTMLNGDGNQPIANSEEEAQPDSIIEKVAVETSHRQQAVTPPPRGEMIEPLPEDRFASRPPKEVLLRKLRSNDPAERWLWARDPRVREQIFEQAGGTPETTEAIKQALAWLSEQQQPDGSWSLQEHGGNMKCDPGATALALMPFLAEGHSHLDGEYRETVDQGIGYLISIQLENGSFFGNSKGNAGMYAHGIATIVVAEAYGMTYDNKLKQPLEKAVEFIIASQHEQGGWRYRPNERGDTSVTAWQTAALFTAEAAGLPVAESTFSNLGTYLESVESFEEHVRYSYVPGQAPTPNMTASGLLIRSFVNSHRQAGAGDLVTTDGIQYLIHERSMNEAFKHDLYGLYHATQVLAHQRGEDWQNWYDSIQDDLVEQQVDAGRYHGCRRPGGRHDKAAGYIFSTVAATTILQAPYRYASMSGPWNLR